MPPRWVLGLGTGEGQGTRTVRSSRSGRLGRILRRGSPQRGWRSGLRVSPLEDSGPPGRCSAPGSRRGQRPGAGSARTWAGEARGREGKGSWRAGLAGALPWHSAAPGSGAGGAPTRSCHRRGEGSPAGLWPQVTGRARGPGDQAANGVGRASGRPGSSGFSSGPAAAWQPKLGAERKSWEPRDWGWRAPPGLSEVGKLFPKFGAAEFPWRRGRGEPGREAPGPRMQSGGRGRGRDAGGAQARVRAAAGCAPCPPGALPPPSPGSCVAPPSPPPASCLSLLPRYNALPAPGRPSCSARHGSRCLRFPRHGRRPGPQPRV